MMRIGIDGRYIQDYYPGIGRYTYSLARRLPEAAPGEQFVLFCNSNLNTRYEVGALSAPNLRLVESRVPTRSLVEQWRLPQAVRDLDLFHSPYYFKPYLLPCPSVVTIHDLTPTIYPESVPSLWARIVFGVTIRLALRSAERIICPSHSARKDLIRLMKVAPGMISAIPEGVEGHFQPLGEGMVGEVVARYGLSRGYILYLGTNKPHKNLVRLVEAYARVKTSHKLVLAGKEDPRHVEAWRTAASLGVEERVIFLGEVSESDLPSLYNGALLFVFPSLYEGFGLPVLEAMACGVPVVCSAASALQEIVGEAALLFDPLKVEAMADAITRALEDKGLREKMRQEGLQQAGQFTWERTAKETLAVYREALLG